MAYGLCMVVSPLRWFDAAPPVSKGSPLLSPLELRA